MERVKPEPDPGQWLVSLDDLGWRWGSLDDILADHLDVAWPARQRVVRVSQDGEVVDEGVDPDVHRLVGVTGDWDTPLHPRARA